MSIYNGKIKIISVIVAVVIYGIWRLTQELNFNHPIALSSEMVINGALMFLITLWLSKRATIRNLTDYTIFLAFIFYLYVLHTLVTYISIEYFIIDNYIGNFHIIYEGINLIPFHTIWKSHLLSVYDPVYYRQIVGNLFLLTPFSFALLALDIISSVKKAVVIQFLISVGIELYQLFESFILSGFKYGESRGIDIDDVILNTLSAVIGIGLYYIYNFFLKYCSSKFKITKS